MLTFTYLIVASSKILHKLTEFYKKTLNYIEIYHLIPSSCLTMNCLIIKLNDFLSHSTSLNKTESSAFIQLEKHPAVVHLAPYRRFC